MTYTSVIYCTPSRLQEHIRSQLVTPLTAEAVFPLMQFKHLLRVQLFRWKICNRLRLFRQLLFQFLYRASTSRAKLPHTLLSSTNPRSSMAFLTVPDSNHPTSTSYSDVDPTPLHLQNTFLAASSTGFILSRGRHPIGTKQSNLAISSTKSNAEYNQPWLCSLPGGMATLAWTDDVRRQDV